MMKVMVFKKGILVIQGEQEYVREWIESELEKKVGFFVMLQECTDDEEFEIYLHSETYEELTEDELEILEDLGINDDPSKSTQVIQSLLELKFELN